MEGSGNSNDKREILLIDDEQVVRDIGGEMLKALGFTCITAENGGEGLRIYKEHPRGFALVILDIEMPGLTGDKVYMKLKELNPRQKILITSGYAQNYLEAKFFKTKLDDVPLMPKPFQYRHLADHLDVLLES